LSGIIENLKINIREKLDKMKKEEVKLSFSGGEILREDNVKVVNDELGFIFFLFYFLFSNFSLF